MVVGSDANNNHASATAPIIVTKHDQAPYLEGYQIHGAYVNVGLSIGPVWRDPNNIWLSHVLVATNYPDLQIDSWTGTIGSVGGVPDSLAGNAYYAITLADNGTQQTTAIIEWIVNQFEHSIRFDYDKDGQPQPPIILRGTDRITAFLRNAQNVAGVFGYDRVATPQEFSEIKTRFVNRPNWAEEDFLHYNYTSSTQWTTTAATLDSIMADIPPYEAYGITFTLQQH